MNNIKNNALSKIIRLEISIKLIEYLKKINSIDDGMYNHIINKLIKKIELEKILVV